jgi:hypothetical protein
MKKLILLLALLGPVWAPAVLRADDAVSIGTGARVQVSTSTPTLLFAANRSAKGTKIKVNPIDGTQTAASADAILVGTSSSASDYSTSLTTGTFRVHAGDKWFALDGPTSFYQGPLYGLAVSTGPLNVDRLQTK